jgi:hypothetical protein
MIFGYLNPFVFILSFGIGLMIVYTINPPPRVVIRFPTPLNAGKVIYREDDTCYKYKVEEVACDQYDEKTKKQVPAAPVMTASGGGSAGGGAPLPKAALASA